MSSDSGIDLREFVTNGRPDVGRILQLGAGTVIGALFVGVAQFILNLADIPIAILSWLAEFLAAEYELLLSIVESLLRGSFAAAADTVASAGVLGFVLAVAIVGTTGFVFSWVISRA